MDSSGTLTADASDARLTAILSGTTVLAAGTVILPFLAIGPLSGHMAVHIATMNVAAPLIAAALARSRPSRLGSATALWAATATQLMLLWASHNPALHAAAVSDPSLLAGVHLALFLSALAFWCCVIHPQGSRWQAIFALLLSGKLACLLGVLLIFAPRHLFAAAGAAHLHHGPAADPVSALGDQQLAGLLMVAACPLSYVLAALVIASQTLTGLSTTQGPSARCASRFPA